MTVQMKSSSIHSSDVKDPLDLEGGAVTTTDADFGGPEQRRTLERRLLWKIDARMSILVIIYILNYIDRNNAAAARLQGFEQDLGLHGQEFNTLLSILYVGYILMQIPSNMLLNWMGRPSLYLPTFMVVWGMISVLTGITTNFTGALLTRFFLGFVEAAFFPGSIFLLSKWYTKKELGFRMAFFYCGSISSNAFGALIASGILRNMGGRLGHAAWRWLFYIEGAITMTVAVLAIFVLPDFPHNTRWLKPEERALAQLRMAEDSVGQGDAGETETGGFAHGLWLALLDWKVWFLAIVLTSFTVALSFNAFFPTLTATLGYNTTISLVLCAPPFIFAAIVAFTLNRHSDKVGERYFHLSSSLCVGIIGYIIAMSTLNTAARYVSLFLMAQSYAALVTYVAWVAATFPRPPSKRAVAIALVNAVSQLGNVAGSYVWPKSWGPTYHNSYAICIATQGLTVVALWFFRMHLSRMNRKMEEEEEKGGKAKGFRFLT
ncbi:MFS general substrate transporter [Vararia minispora EC-137]|uniref:MFS general substrate transporter n=1 Tax=Vararia minispora EC-137 TaxID=1314806 RepID=A0ACB8QBQ0_9AGAM|nr:MFS general substrate transporter [Vararia minispora EC-137]